MDAMHMSWIHLVLHAIKVKSSNKTIEYRNWCIVVQWPNTYVVVSTCKSGSTAMYQIISQWINLFVKMFDFKCLGTKPFTPAYGWQALWELPSSPFVAERSGWYMLGFTILCGRSSLLLSALSRWWEIVTPLLLSYRRGWYMSGFTILSGRSSSMLSHLWLHRCWFLFLV